MPDEAGRVIRDGAPVPGRYVTGWIKRGPSGMIGTNKGCAAETVDSVLADLPGLPAPARPDPGARPEPLERKGVRAVEWAKWLRLDAKEVRRGAGRSADRVKVADLTAMLATCHGG